MTEMDDDSLRDLLLATLLSQRDATWRVDEEQMKEARKHGLIMQNYGNVVYLTRASKELTLSLSGVVMSGGDDD